MVTALDMIGNDSELQEHWLKRVVALIVDAVIVNIIAWVLMTFVILAFWTVPYLWLGVQPFFSGLLLFVYSFVLEGISGATLGKKLMDLRVIPISGQMDLGKAALRNVSKIHVLFFFIDWLVGFVTEGDPKQRMLDRYAGTTVVITSRVSDQQQHLYQSQQARYAPPPQESYQTRHDQVYQYPPPPPTGTPQQPAGQPQEATCPACGGRMILTGNGRLQCIRCGKIQ